MRVLVLCKAAVLCCFQSIAELLIRLSHVLVWLAGFRMFGGSFPKTLQSLGGIVFYEQYSPHQVGKIVGRINFQRTVNLVQSFSGPLRAKVDGRERVVRINPIGYCSHCQLEMSNGVLEVARFV